MERKAKEIALFIGGELVGDGEVVISGVNGIKEAGEKDLAFLLSPKLQDLISSTRAGCVVVPKDLRGPFARTVIKVENPSIVFLKVIDAVMPDRISHPKGVHPSAVIAKTAKLGSGVAVGVYSVVEDGASIGDNTVIHPLSYVGGRTKIGRDCIIYPNVTVREGVSIGDRVIIHSGSVIGSDGFGYDTAKDGTHVKIPQLGTVVIEDDVELGACVAIDRARFNKTVIGKGSKIDNLVQIAHNVIIGPNCLVAAQSGIAGSSELGRNVVLGGQVGVSDHIGLGDFTMAGAQSGITRSFPPKTVLFGYPAKPVEKERKILACTGLLPKLYERVKALENKLKGLEKSDNKTENRKKDR